jgi:nucleoside-diphosphate-sugar epimerase
VKSALKNEPIIVNFDGKQERDFIHVDDVVKGIILMLRRNYKPGIYEIGTGKSIKIIDLAKLIISLSGSKSKIVFRRPKVEEVRKSKANRPLMKNFKKLEIGIKGVIKWMESQ